MPIGKYQKSDFEKPCKAIPAKVVIEQSEFELQGFLCHEKYFICPQCSEVFGQVKKSDLKQYNYCYNCGQRLDWS